MLSGTKDTAMGPEVGMHALALSLKLSLGSLALSFILAGTRRKTSAHRIRDLRKTTLVKAPGGGQAALKNNSPG